jgi:hypothetical protein
MAPSEHNGQRHAPQHEITPRETAATARPLSETDSLREKLAAARLRAANLEAAMRAALRADSEGEIDPLSYLRDEIGDYPGGAHGA